MVEYLGIDQNQTLEKGEYLISFEYDPDQYTSAMTLEYAGKIGGQYSGTNVGGRDFEKSFNMKMGELIQQIKEELNKSDIYVKNYSVNTTTLEDSFGNRLVIPRVINFEIMIQNNPFWVWALAGLFITILVVAFPEPIRCSMQKLGEGVGGGVGAVAEGIGTGLTKGFMPLLIFGGLGFLAYMYIKK